jgi:hypothetical protein
MRQREEKREFFCAWRFGFFHALFLCAPAHFFGFILVSAKAQKSTGSNISQKPILCHDPGGMNLKIEYLSEIKVIFERV